MKEWEVFQLWFPEKSEWNEPSLWGCGADGMRGWWTVRPEDCRAFWRWDNGTKEKVNWSCRAVGIHIVGLQGCGEAETTFRFGWTHGKAEMWGFLQAWDEIIQNTCLTYTEVKHRYEEDVKIHIISWGVKEMNSRCYEVKCFSMKVYLMPSESIGL